MTTIQLSSLGQTKAHHTRTSVRQYFSRMIAGNQTSTAKYARGYAKPYLR
ncbi:MAG: hypothetical protein IAE67_02960 [Candidatus Competibacteraceae bacterium]|nr:hypothetical protein [Candidatus Competibacteraceae bacterium]